MSKVIEEIFFGKGFVQVGLELIIFLATASRMWNFLMNNKSIQI